MKREALLQLVRPVMFLLMLTTLVFYLFENIKALGEDGVALNMLAISLMLGLLLIVLELIEKKVVFVRSTYILLVFYFYYVIKVFVDMEEGGAIKAYTLSTDGGVILFYLTGALISINLSSLKSVVVQFMQRAVFVLFFAFSLVFSLLLVDCFFELYQWVRDDIFLVSRMDDVYQRPGGFLVIGYFVYTLLFGFLLFMRVEVGRAPCFRVCTLLAFVLYCFSAIGGMLLAQLFGSNSAFVCIGGFLFVATLAYILLNYGYIELWNRFKKGPWYGLFAITLVFASLSLVIDLIFFMGGMVLLEIELNQLRIFGYGAIYNEVNTSGTIGSISSISSRVDLWGNFLTHFNYSPILGNMAVDLLTTGEGTYVHSFLGSLVTHLGLVGVFLFLFYIVSCIQEKLKFVGKSFMGNVESIYQLVLFSGVFLIACVAVFFVWVPMWFLLGMVFSPVHFVKRRSE